ncbi:hypothetical protein [Pedobacter panaciterrae]
MIFRNNNRNNANRMQQQTIGNLQTVVVTYPHRLDENGHPLIRIRFVRSTVEPDFRYTSFNAWCMRIKREVSRLVIAGGSNDRTA